MSRSSDAMLYDTVPRGLLQLVLSGVRNPRTPEREGGRRHVEAARVPRRAGVNPKKTRRASSFPRETVPGATIANTGTASGQGNRREDDSQVEALVAHVALVEALAERSEPRGDGVH